MRAIPALCIAALTTAGSAQAAPLPEELAKLAQNPIAKLISVPFKLVADGSLMAVELRIEPGSPWVHGALVDHLGSAGSGDDPACNNFLLQPVVDHNLPGGVYVNSGPVIAADWQARLQMQSMFPK